MLFRLLILLFLFLGSYCNGYAQTFIIEGEVKDSITNTPLDYVSIYIETVNGKIIAFTNTDEKGYYRIDCSNNIDSMLIIANMLGYQKKATLFFEMNEYIKHNLFLVQSAFELEEIVVSESSLPIMEKKDTTIYNVDSYIDSTEYSVEDILKKIPGVQVSEGGGITVNGKPIDKVLIENDDMFGTNYTIGTRNIRANIIDKVQVIDHYQDNPVLKNVQESNRMVLNLIIKEEKKNIISGTYTIGAGYGERFKHYLHVNMFSLSKKAKTFLLGNYNNNGFDAKGEINATFTDLAVHNQAIDNSLNHAPSLINLPNIQYIGLPEKFTNRRRLGLSSLSHIVNATPSFKIKLTGAFYREKNEQRYFNQNRLFSSIDTLIYKEESSYLSTHLFTEVVIQTDYLPKNQHSSLKTYTNIAGQNNKVNLFLNREENNVSEYIPQFTKELPNRIFNALEYTRRLNSNSASQVIISHSYSKNRQQLNSSNNKYLLYADGNLDSLIQNSVVAQNESKIIFKYIYNKNFLLNLDIGYSWGTNTLVSDSRLFEERNEVENKSLSANNIKIDKSSPILRATINKRILAIDFSLGIQTSLEMIKNMPTIASNYWLVTPFLQLKIPLNSATAFNLLYQYQNKLPELGTLTNQFFFTDYQTISTGILDFTPLKEHRIIGRFRYKDVLNSFYFNANGYFSNSKNILGSSFNFNEDIFRYTFYRPAPLSTYGGAFSAEKLFFDISSRFSLKYNYSSYSTQTKINQLTQDIDYITNEFFLDYGSAYDIPINFYLTNSLRFTTTTSSSIEEKNRLLTWNAKFKLIYRPSKNISLDASWYSIYNQINSSFDNRLNSLEMNASFIFEKERRRHDISIGVVNLLNTKQFITNNIDSYFQNQYGLDATPRFFLLKWDTSF